MSSKVTISGVDYWIDILDGVKGRFTAGQGWELHRKITVNNLSGTTTGRLLTATAALALLTPPIFSGCSHPDLATAILENLVPEAVGIEAVKFDLVYREHYATANAGGLIEVGSSLAQEQTNRDVNGNPLTVNYFLGFKCTDPEDALIDQCATTSVPIPQPTLKKTRQETGSPGGKSELYVGAANQAGWAVDPTAPARSWLCTGINGPSKDGGNTYQVSYTFQKKMGVGGVAGTWDVRVVWIDPKTGRPPSDVESQAGAVLVAQVVPEKDFDALGLYP